MNHLSCFFHCRARVRYPGFTARAPGAGGFLSLLILTVLAIPALSCVPMQYPQKEIYYETMSVTENRTELVSETNPVTRIVSGQEQLTPYILWSSPSVKFKGTRFVWYHGYRLPGAQAHDIEKIRISLYKQYYYENVAVSLFDMGRRGQVLQPPLISPQDPVYTNTVQWDWFTYDIEAEIMDNWLNSANIKFNFARYLGGQADLWMNRWQPYDIEFDTRGAREIAVLFTGPTTPQNTRFSASLLWYDHVTENVTTIVERTVPYQVEQSVQSERTVNKTSLVPFWQAPPFK
ncbi:MAG: hypothetical protein WC566_10390 [Dehalococcoidia bacterium]